MPLRVRKSQGCPLGRDVKIYFRNDVAFAVMEGEDLEKRTTTSRMMLQLRVRKNLCVSKSKRYEELISRTLLMLRLWKKRKEKIGR